MKVLHLSSEKSWRGGEQQIAYLIEQHKKSGIDCHILSRKKSAFSQVCLEKQWNFEEAGFGNSFDLSSAYKVLSYCNTNNIDIVHMHTSRSHGVGVLSSAMGNKSHLVLSRRVDFPLKHNVLSRWKYNHPSIKRILCVSDKIKEIAQKGVHRKEICQTIYDGIDVNKFDSSQHSGFLRKKYSIDDNTFLIGNTSAIADHKDYHTFVNTAREVLKGNIPVCFFIIGTGPMELSIKKYVEDQGLEDKVVFTGFLDNITEVLPELDMFLMTSKTEGLGTSLLDAMAAGVPIVSTEAGGIPEIVIHNKTGLTAAVKNYKSLAAHVIEILNNDVLKNYLVNEALGHVKKFDKKIMAEKTLEVYKEIL